MNINIKPIGGNYKVPDLAKIVAQEVAKEARAIQREFEITTRTWKRKPVFMIELETDSSTVGTTDKIYGYVDKGTRPHLIRPKGPYPLRFNGAGFVAKTVPNRINPRAGRAAGPPAIRAQVVHHPGTEARNFTKIVQERSDKRFYRNLEKAIALAAQGKGT